MTRCQKQRAANVIAAADKIKKRMGSPEHFECEEIGHLKAIQANHSKILVQHYIQLYLLFFNYQTLSNI